MTTKVKLERGNRYRIYHQSPSQGYMRVSVMDYLDDDDQHHVFSARPVAGTQTLPKSWVIRIVEVSTETPVSINGRA